MDALASVALRMCGTTMPTAPASSAASVAVSLDYSGFKDAFGGDVDPAENLQGIQGGQRFLPRVR